MPGDHLLRTDEVLDVPAEDADNWGGRIVDANCRYVTMEVYRLLAIHINFILVIHLSMILGRQ